MRVLLSTLAILAIATPVATPAFANEQNRDPERSIQKSDTVGNEAGKSNYDRSVSGTEPAAGDTSQKQYRETDPATGKPYMTDAEKKAMKKKEANKRATDSNSGTTTPASPSRME